MNPSPVLTSSVGTHAVALTEAYRKHAHDLRRFVRSVIIDPQYAEDVVHETFLELWIHPDRFDPSRSDLQSWLRTIARRRAIDRIRSLEAARARDIRVGTRDYNSVDQSPDRWDSLLSRKSLHTALARLTEHQRTAVLARYIEELSSAELAAKFGVPSNTAKTRVRDGLITLRRYLSAP